MPTIGDSVPLSALKHLEPYPGGQWAITGQTNNVLALTYAVNGMAEAISYSVRRCATEEDVRTHCQSQLYTFVSPSERERRRRATKASEGEEQRPEESPLLHLKMESVENFNWDELSFATTSVPESFGWNETFPVDKPTGSHYLQPQDQMGTHIQIDMPQQPCFIEPLFPVDESFSMANQPSISNQEWYRDGKFDFLQNQDMTQTFMGDPAGDPQMATSVPWEGQDSDTFMSLLLQD